MTFCQWLDALKKCDDRGREQEPKNGWLSPMPWADGERRLKMKLGQWLPEARASRSRRSPGFAQRHTARHETRPRHTGLGLLAQRRAQ